MLSIRLYTELLLQGARFPQHERGMPLSLKQAGKSRQSVFIHWKRNEFIKVPSDYFLAYLLKKHFFLCRFSWYWAEIPVLNVFCFILHLVDLKKNLEWLADPFVSGWNQTPVPRVKCTALKMFGMTVHFGRTKDSPSHHHHHHPSVPHIPLASVSFWSIHFIPPVESGQFGSHNSHLQICHFYSLKYFQRIITKYLVIY